MHCQHGGASSSVGGARWDPDGQIRAVVGSTAASRGSMLESGFHVPLTTASGIGHGGWVLFSSTRFGLATRGPKLTNVSNAPTQAERPLYPRQPCVRDTRKWYCDDGQHLRRLIPRTTWKRPQASPTRSRRFHSHWSRNAFCAASRTPGTTGS
ncbi:hypothetical protein MRX96_028120 [Rhipicephalus microplus]